LLTANLEHHEKLDYDVNVVIGSGETEVISRSISDFWCTNVS